MALAKVQITGDYEMLMHSDATVDPLNPLTKRIRTFTKKRTKTDEDYATIARLDWEAGLYFDDDLGVYIPAENIHKCILEGGKVNRLGQVIKEGVFLTTDRVPLQYDGPRDIEGLWADPRFRLTKSVKVTTTRIMRTRPRFPKGWRLDFELDYVESIINEDDLRLSVREAGRRKGLGDYRPIYGRFTATVNGRE